MHLADVAGKVRFPILALPPTTWSGPMYVADVRSIGDEVRALQMMYLTPQGGSGIVISHLSPEVGGAEDPYRLTEHLTGFVSHFAPKVLRSKVKRGKYLAFASSEYEHHDEMGMVNGRPAAMTVISHRVLPLRAVRTAVQMGSQIGDLCMAGWERPVLDLIPTLTPVTPEVVRAFDVLSEDPI